MERITKEALVAEFGQPGVENPTMLDLISVDKDSGDVVLLMIEKRRWDQGFPQLRQLEQKIDRYLSYALDGFLTQHYPQFLGKPVRIALDCVEAPYGRAADLLAAAAKMGEHNGIRFSVNVTATA